MVISAEPSQIVVSVDWFALSLVCLHPYRDGEVLAVPTGWQVVEMSATATWLKRFFILDAEGVKLATFLTRPRHPKIDERRALLEVANQILYSSEFTNVTSLLLNMLPMYIDGINRVDLCADFMMTAPKWEVVRQLELGESYLKGLRRGVVWWTAHGAKKDPHQLSWGGLESVFHWKLYNKYKELHEGGSPVASKPYIEDMWRECGMQPKCVWRLEVSITGGNRVVDIMGKPIAPFQWYDEREVIYQRIYSDKFLIRHNEGHKDRRNDPVVEFLEIGHDFDKFLRHRKPKSVMESDVERRVVCKAWKEYTDPEVRANDVLKAALRDFLATMFQFERNINAVARRFNLTSAEVVSAVLEC